MGYSKPPNFAKGLFLGRLNEKILFPYPRMSGEEKESLDMVLESLSGFLKEKVDGAAIDEQEKVPGEVIRGLGEMGILGSILPEEYDGFGMSQTAYCKVSELLSRACASTTATVGAHLSIGTKPIVLYGTEEQKKRFLPKCATGEWISCFALTEPEAGSDAQSLRTSARRTQDGKHFILEGTKQWITNAAFAHVFLIFARVEGEDPGGITCFIVTRDMEGLTVGKNESKLGLKGSATNQLVMESLKVPAENILGEIGQGFKIALNTLNYGRLSLGACCLGAAKEMIQHAVAHASERKQFGVPIASFEMIEDKIWKMVTDTYVLESVVYFSAGLCDRGEKDFQVESAVCKTFGTEILWNVINEAIQIAGGNGFMKEYPYERFLRDARVNMIFEGTNEIQRIFIALAGFKEVGIYLKGAMTPGGAVAYLAKKTGRALAGTRLKNAHSLLSDEAAIVGDYTALLAEKAERVVRFYKKEVIHQEYIQARVADMVIDLMCLAATVSRVTSRIDAVGEEEAAMEIAVLKTFSNAARRRLNDNATAIDQNDDDLRKEIAQHAVKQQGYDFPLF